MRVVAVSIVVPHFRGCFDRGKTAPYAEIRLKKTFNDGLVPKQYEKQFWKNNSASTVPFLEMTRDGRLTEIPLSARILGRPS